MILIDDSTHSTFAAGRQSSPSKEYPYLQPKSPTLIWFEEDDNEYYDNEEVHAEDCAELWYTRDDYANFRANMREQIRVALEEQQRTITDEGKTSFFQVLKTLFIATSNVDYILTNVSEALTEAQEKQISHLYNCDECRIDLIGLEHHVVDAIKKDKRIHREAIQDVVYEIQLEHNKGLWSDVEATSNVDYILTNVSEALTEAQEKQISHLYSCDECRIDLIGLEHHVVDAIKKDARVHREAIQDAVYEIQLEHNKGLWSDMEAQDELRESCINFTQASGLFAQLLAKAQQAS
eukprot:CAMPEP_0198154672 /NCGR_PEP_ID=MMETSP1443-20131203/68727_1 /TAXON_ID=186043 /ORGANISM="Entomoneis sp., Strain CCMP2396" /LENGTH=292 /DNA_ID=CAMNT_0043821369 /DNA_START=76 /DNA_END=954 /DNA_ORIENTATION=-